MNEPARAIVVAALAFFSSAAVARAEPATASGATSALTQAHPGLQAHVDGERLVGLSGAVMVENTPAVATADFVGTFIEQNAAAFGVPELDFDFERSASLTGGHAVYTYHQIIENLPVHDRLGGTVGPMTEAVCATAL